ncbi:MAG: 3-deoxy-7-phosphoheptulonate synthase [Verrucomicrobia bacterium]|jgi:3-deoxy-7-phosphoheptulonate synthase|nr:3-deoxy-7-phosphoheptulonate synthase [Verrucomicrobiota bacterium]
MDQTQNLHVRKMVRLVTPNELKAELPMTEAASRTVVQSRERLMRILRQEDPRLLVVVGPCSIHNVDAAFEYARRLSRLQRELADRMEIVMRVYFEKPRTTIGWKGLINDPHLDGTQDIEAGLRMARQLLRQVNELGLPAGTEFLDPIVPQYTAELISWAAIGARTTESQTHREMASGLSMPVGYKNATDGSLQTAVDAMSAARSSHSFLGIDEDGVTSIVRTSGNPDGHLILRGGRDHTNYDAESIRLAEAALRKANLPGSLMVDCSHANSGKKPERQELVWQNVIAQRTGGNRSVIGMMVESNLEEGSQPFPQPPEKLNPGVSITDACISWSTTERLLRQGYQALA